MAFDHDAQALALKALARTARKPFAALSTVKALLDAGQDCNLGIWTDSIGTDFGNGTTTLREWPALLADRFAAAYPHYKVQVFRFDAAATNLYEAAPVAIQSPAGSPPVLTIYNCAVAGARLLYMMANRWMAGFAALSLDALIVSHGHNHIFLDAANPHQSGPIERGELLAGIEQFKACKPGVPVDLVLENPRRDDTDLDGVIAAWRKAAQFRDLGLIDVHGAFLAAGKPASLYQSTGDTANDNVHPGQAGSDLYRDVIWHAFESAESRFVDAAPSLLLPRAGDVNLLANGDFAKWTISPGAPDGWTAGGAGTLTIEKDAAMVADARLGYSARLTGTGGPSYIVQNLSAAVRQKLFGQTVTLAFKRYTASSTGTLGIGQVNVIGTAGGAKTYPVRAFGASGGWTWHVLSGIPIPRDCTSLAVLLYHDGAASPAADAVYFDQAVLIPGYLPAAVR